MTSTPPAVSSNWDRAYNDGKYDQEGPIPFTNDIVAHIKKAGLSDGRGFYPGCGNGRNLIPLLKSGLRIKANDISRVAVEQLKSKFSAADVEVGDFSSLTGSSVYDYLLSIQLFQHVNKHGPEPLFEKTSQLLKPGGLFFLRVNSLHTHIIEEHSLIDTTQNGGITIQYESGQKKGQRIHFYSAEEIHALTNKDFKVVMPLREEFILRNNGTYWVQWETVLRKY